MEGKDKPKKYTCVLNPSVACQVKTEYKLQPESLVEFCRICPVREKADFKQGELMVAVFNASIQQSQNNIQQMMAVMSANMSQSQNQIAQLVEIIKQLAGNQNKPKKE